MLKIFLLVFLLATVALAYNLPEVFTTDVRPAPVERQFDAIERYLTELEDSLSEIDTVHNRIDSVSSEVDTLRLRADSASSEIDTANNRIDSLMTRDSVFYAYDAGGGFTLPTATTKPIPLDTEIRKDGIYGHDADSAAVAVSTAGWYEISYAFSVQPATANDIAFQGYLDKYSGSWAAIGGSRQYDKAGSSTGFYASVSMAVIVQLSAGDSIRVIGYNLSGSYELTTVANTVNLMIKKIQ